MGASEYTWCPIFDNSLYDIENSHSLTVIETGNGLLSTTALVNACQCANVRCMVSAQKVYTEMEADFLPDVTLYKH